MVKTKPKFQVTEKNLQRIYQVHRSNVSLLKIGHRVKIENNKIVDIRAPGLKPSVREPTYYSM